ncbi:PaaX family transcriptional regulator [Luedemannella helvata]|uniref:PaaX family transcriptional regulator C-terminal domain-containing protein n=1 Tax=Luedemannella helvata TaxID=349315 RepID=A0ABP4WTP4_9ACTN
MVSPYEIEELFPDTAAGSVRLPRQQAGSSPQGLAMTLVADYTVSTRAWLPSAALVTLLHESGVTTAGARAAISRLARRGVLESSRDGRHTFYRLTSMAASDLSSGGAWIAGFATRADTWDECWTLVAFSLPQNESTQRRLLRGQLRWLGFAPLYDGLWVSPDALNPTVKDGLVTIGGGAISVFRASHVELPIATNRNPIDAWDVAVIARHYEEFIQHWRPQLARVRSGKITGAAAVRARTEIMDTYRRFPLLDPQLPVQLMPDNWPRSRAGETFMAVYDGLAEAAEAHVRAAAARFGDPHPGIRAHTTAELAAGFSHTPDAG